MTDSELIEAVATEVMEWKPDGIHDCTEMLKLGGFDPFTNANHIFMVVERMRELGYDKFGHAVCLAALQAVREKRS